jgi:RecB family exonuclease
VEKELVRLRKRRNAGKVEVELELAFTKRWTMTDWLAKDVYLRVKIDVVEKLPKKAVHITDWKTGQVRDSSTYDDQLNLYALALLHTGVYRQAKARLIFTDHGKTIARPAGEMEMGDVPFARQVWDDRAGRMLTAKDFPPNPNYTCKWCAFAKSKGGPCKFG